jgi:hypothetical protein
LSRRVKAEKQTKTCKDWCVLVGDVVVDVVVVVLVADVDDDVAVRVRGFQKLRRVWAGVGGWVGGSCVRCV